MNDKIVKNNKVSGKIGSNFVTSEQNFLLHQNTIFRIFDPSVVDCSDLNVI